MAVRTYTAHVRVMLRPGVPDSASDIAKRTFGACSLPILEARAGRYFEVKLEAKSHRGASKEIRTICAEALVNPTIETYEFDIHPKPRSKHAKR